MYNIMGFDCICRYLFTNFSKLFEEIFEERNELFIYIFAVVFFILTNTV